MRIYPCASAFFFLHTPYLSPPIAVQRPWRGLFSVGLTSDKTLKEGLTLTRRKEKLVKLCLLPSTNSSHLGMN